MTTIEITVAEARALADKQMTRGNKFGAKKATSPNWPNVVFHSRAERDYADVLFFRQKAGEIGDLELQPRFEFWINKVRCGTYVADFQYTDPAFTNHVDLEPPGDRRVVVDVKSKATRTPVYRRNVLMMRALFGIDVVEVE